MKERTTLDASGGPNLAPPKRRRVSWPEHPIVRPPDPETLLAWPRLAVQLEDFYGHVRGGIRAAVACDAVARGA